MDNQNNLTPDPKLKEPSKAPSIPLNRKKFILPSPLLIILVVLGFCFAILIFSFLSKRAAKTFPVPKTEVKDASQIPSPDTVQTVTEQVPAILSGTEEGSSLAEKPMPFLSLSGIVYDITGSAALINGKVVPEGGFVEGARLDKVFSDRVELTFEGKKIILRNR